MNTDQINTRKVQMQVKSVGDDGSFEGYAAVHGNVDQGNDIIEQGAFTKTLQERNKKAPVFDEHKVRVGAASLEEDDFGLKTFGKLNLDKQSGKDAYSDLKFYRDEGMHMGMSIGYAPVAGKVGKDASGARLLKEVKLYEVTLTIMPMNELAGVTHVKSMDCEELLASMEEFNSEMKSGRKISKDRAARMLAIINEFQSLMQEAGIETGITTPTDEPNSGKSAEPDYHSLLTTFDKFTLKGVPKWN